MLVNYLKGVFSASRSNQLGLSKSLHPHVCAYFGRRIAEKATTLADRLGERKFKKPDSGILEHDFEERADPAAKELDDKWMSLCHLNAQTLPENFMARIAKVFAKFPQEEVRKMGRTYMKLYQIIHATEKPMDISSTKPFVNSNELIKGRESLIYLGKKYRHHEKPESETQAKEKKRKEKEKEETIRKVQEGEVDPSDSAADPDYQTIVYDRHTALAYLQRKVPHTFGVASRILTELRYRLPDFKPQSFLDFGAGLGSGSYAFYDVYRNFQKIIAVEPSTPMRKLGKYLTQDLQQISWFDSLARLINVADHDGFFDIVYCGFVLEEAKTPEARMLIVETLWQKVRPGGLLILVEPGSPKGFRFVHDFREWIVQKPREEASIVAPCPHHLACPQAKPAHLWCNFGQDIAKYPNRVFNKLPNQRTIDNEKFSFIVVKKGEIINNKEEAKTPAERSFFWPRLIRPTLKRGGHVIVDTCNSAGAIERIIVAKSHKEEGAYKHAKKTEWGDLWCFGKRVPNRFRKESRIGERLW